MTTSSSISGAGDGGCFPDPFKDKTREEIEEQLQEEVAGRQPPDTPDSPTEDPPKEGWRHTEEANLRIMAGIVLASLDISTGEGCTGHGFAWGLGGGKDSMRGVLAYNSWDALSGTENSFTVVGTQNGMAVSFYVDDVLVGIWFGEGYGAKKEVTFGGSGWFNWK